MCTSGVFVHRMVVSRCMESESPERVVAVVEGLVTTGRNGNDIVEGNEYGEPIWSDIKRTCEV